MKRKNRKVKEGISSDNSQQKISPVKEPIDNEEFYTQVMVRFQNRLSLYNHPVPQCIHSKNINENENRMPRKVSPHCLHIHCLS